MKNELEFHNPYHFVPIPHESRENWKPADTFFTDTSGHWTHSRYITQEGVHSGRIVCRLTTETPIFIGSRRTEEVTENRPAIVLPFELDGQPAIPASSLRGLISSIAEAASNSSLRVLENRYLSRRQAMREALNAIGILKRNPQNKKWEVLPLVLPPLSCHENGELKFVPAAWKKLFPTANLRVYIDGYYSDKNNTVRQSEGSFLEKYAPDSFSSSRQEYWYMKLSPAHWTDGRKEKLKVNRHHIKEITSHNGPSKFFLVGQKAEGRPISQHEYESLKESEQGIYTKGILRVLGIQGRESEIPSGKKHEIFIPLPPNIENNLRLSADSAVERFHKLANQRTEADENLPFTLQGMQRNEKGLVCLRENDLVFFNLKDEKKEHPEIKNISISSIWRDEIPGMLFDYFSNGGTDKEILPFHKDRKRVSPAEMVFGFVEDRKRGESETEQAKAYAGRVRFSHGLLEGDASAPYMDSVPLKILDSPKPPCPAMYFTQRTGEPAYIPKKDLNAADHRPQGRKFYLHHPYNEGMEPWRTEDPKENWKQKVTITPIKKDEIFWFHVDFTNLNNDELGMLLYSLRPDDSFRHKIGMGKPIGLGTVRIDPVLLHFIDRKSRYRQFPAASSCRYSRTLQLESSGALPYDYKRMINNAEMVEDWKAWTNEFAQSIPDSVKKALCLLGDPKKIKYQVHTPLLVTQAGEEETFKWFGANDDTKNPDYGQFLSPIQEGDTGIPTLKRNVERQKK